MRHGIDQTYEYHVLQDKTLHQQDSTIVTNLPEVITLLLLQNL